MAAKVLVTVMRPLAIGCRFTVLLIVVSALLSGCRLTDDVGHLVESYPDRSVSEVLAIANRKAVAQGIEVQRYEMGVCYSVGLDRWSARFSDRFKEIGGHFSLMVGEENEEVINEYEMYTDRTVAFIMELVHDEVSSRGFDTTGYEEIICFSPESRTWSILFSKYDDKSFSEFHVAINDHDLDVTVEVCDGVYDDHSPPRCK